VRDVREGLGDAQLLAVIEPRSRCGIELRDEVEPHSVGHCHDRVELGARVAVLDALDG
jgi:hypothetical protein